jgi:hypothetical protein
VASIGAVLDGAAIMLSTGDFAHPGRSGADLNGPLMAVAYGMPTVVKIGVASSLPIDPPVRLLDLMASDIDSPPTIAITRTEFADALDRLGDIVAVPENERDHCWARFCWIRSGYDQALRGLAGLTLATPAPWTTDRPARTARPRFLLRHPIAVDWTVHPPS